MQIDESVCQILRVVFKTGVPQTVQLGAAIKRISSDESAEGDAIHRPAFGPEVASCLVDGAESRIEEVFGDLE